MCVGGGVLPSVWVSGCMQVCVEFACLCVRVRVCVCCVCALAVTLSDISMHFVVHYKVLSDDDESWGMTPRALVLTVSDETAVG